MKAKIRFYLRTIFGETSAKVLQIISADDVSDDDRAWYKQSAKAIGLPPDYLGRVYWDKEREQFYLFDPNRQRFTEYGSDGFEGPDFIIGLEGQISEIQADVSYHTKKTQLEGVYKKSETDTGSWIGLSDNIRGVLHLELLSEGRERYLLKVRGATGLVDLDMFVRRIRSGGLTPHLSWS